jgi:hypothetical protein
LNDGLGRWGYDGWHVAGITGRSLSEPRQEFLLNIEAFRTGGGRFRIYAILSAFGRVSRLSCYQ